MEAKYTTNLPQVAYSAQQVKQFEEEAALQAGYNLSQLMQFAGEALFSLFDHELVSAQRILLLAGKGNNAGDAYVLAKLLYQSGREVLVYSIEPPSLLTGDAKSAYQKAHELAVPMTDKAPEIEDYCVIVDGVFGTGFRGQLTPALKSLFTACKKSKATRLSIDIPSGVNGTTAQVAEGSFEANITMTFIGLKQGCLTGAAKAHSGTLLYAPLEVGNKFAELVQSSISSLDQKSLFALAPKRALTSYKNQCGHVLLVGGNKGMAGAIRLAAEACLRSGAGLVSVATHPDNVAMVLQGRYELMVHGIDSDSDLEPLMAKADILVVGPGMGQDEWAHRLFNFCLAFPKPVVCDADGLNMLAKSEQRFNSAVLTPHMGEAKRLLADTSDFDEHARFNTVTQLVAQYAATVVLKGPGSLIGDSRGININRSGCAAMASAGMGDVLSGIIGGLLAQGMPIFAATSLAVYIHGLAAQIAAKDGEKGLLASDLFIYIRRLLG